MRLTRRNSSSTLLAALVLTATAIVDAKTDDPPPTPTDKTSQASSICTSSPHEIVPDGCASYSTLESLNRHLYPLVSDITRGTDYFGYYRLDLFGRTCPFWSDDEGMCGNIACAVNTIDNEEEIPPVWRAEELGKLTGPKATHPTSRKSAEPSPLQGALGEETEESCIVEEDECDERDYCVPEDESQGSKGVYVSLLENPERFTGYVGAGAENVWKAIYRENCFSKTSAEEGISSTSNSVFGGAPGARKADNPAAMDFVNVLQDKGKHELVAKKMDGHQPTMLTLDVDDECLEKRVFYRIISGMHSSISMHLCWDYLNQSTGEWAPNLECFINRFQTYPERLQNIYFNYAILLRAVGKLRNYLPSYTFCSGDYYQNRLTKSKVLKLTNAAAAGGEIFDESLMFKDEMIALKDDFRNRFRNVSRLMDCVGCDKCRLWGKVQTQGYGTALKVLFEFDENAGEGKNPTLRRTELVALINTLDRVSHSLIALEKFQEMWATRNRTERIERGEETEEDLAHITREGQRNRQKAALERSVSEVFWEEWDAMWYAFFWVIKSWIMLPKLMFTVALSHVTQWWDVLMGRPKSPPLYRWKTKDEL
ncbi:endoplasmic oxidoreductin-1 [Rhizina undulata]